jgi:hypothetical protein
MASPFRSNISTLDRIIRVIVGALLAGDLLTGLQVPEGWIGLILIVTGLLGICPVYSLFGINTKTMGENVGLK